MRVLEFLTGRINERTFKRIETEVRKVQVNLICIFALILTNHFEELLAWNISRSNLLTTNTRRYVWVWKIHSAETLLSDWFNCVERSLKWWNEGISNVGQKIEGISFVLISILLQLPAWKNKGRERKNWSQNFG